MLCITLFRLELKWYRPEVFLGCFVSVSSWHDTQSCIEYPLVVSWHILHWGYLAGTDGSGVSWTMELTETVHQLWHPNLAPVYATILEGNINHGAHQPPQTQREF